MSLLTHQSAINPTQNFWGKGGGTLPSNAPFVVASNESVQPFDALLDEGQRLVLQEVSLPALTFNVVYIITATWNINSGGVDSDIFKLSIDSVESNSSTSSNTTASKGWYSQSVIGSVGVLAGDSDVVQLAVSYDQPGTVNVFGNTTWSVIGFPI